MGFCNLPIGLSGAVTLITVPQLMAAQGMPESTIAMVTTMSLVPGFINFLAAPLLDWRLSRRSYAIIMALLCGVFATATLVATGNVTLLTLLVTVQAFLSYLNQAAVGGWLSGLTKPEQKNALGAWLQAVNVFGFGAGAAISILLIRNLPPGVGAVAVGMLNLVPIPLYLRMPAKSADAQLSHGGFAVFMRDLRAVLRQPTVRWLVFFLAMPAASFALSNTMSGLGKDFGASEELVGAVAGIGCAIAGVFGALVVAPLIRGRSPEKAWLFIGAIGAAFTLSQIVVPRTPLTFAIMMIGQNAVQAAAFSVVNAIALRSIREDNPLAATQYALLMAANGLPLAYMQAVDGSACDHGGLVSSYLTDALVSLAACAVLGLLLTWRQTRKISVEPDSPAMGIMEIQDIAAVEIVLGQEASPSAG